jgi:hypothetical protein
MCNVDLYIERENGDLLVFEVPVGRGSHDWQPECEELMRMVGATKAKVHRRLGTTVDIFYGNLESKPRWALNSRAQFWRVCRVED